MDVNYLTVIIGTFSPSAVTKLSNDLRSKFILKELTRETLALKVRDDRVDANKCNKFRGVGHVAV